MASMSPIPSVKHGTGKLLQSTVGVLEGGGVACFLKKRFVGIKVDRNFKTL